MKLHNKTTYTLCKKL